MYLVIGNLPWHEHYKLENVLIVGVIPGPNEHKQHINAYLKPLVDELLDLWNGCFIQTTASRIEPVRCALMHVSCDLPATRKTCGFMSYTSVQGCSKCMKRLPCESFGKKSDYSGYNKEPWPLRTNELHREQVQMFEDACTATAHHEVWSEIHWAFMTAILWYRGVSRCWSNA